MFADDDDTKIKGISGQIYVKQEAIGSGAFGTVIYVQNQANGEKLVCKSEELTERYSTLLFEAWVIQKFTQQLIGTTVKCLQVKDVEYKHARFSIIMESGGISLNKYIEKYGNFTDTTYSVKNLQYLIIVRQTLLLLKHFHQTNLIHRDIKPQNITMIPNTMEVFIIDFGLVARYNPLRQSDINKVSFAGTIYFAPRAAHRRAVQAPRDDIESLCYTLIYINGSLPWRGIPIGDDKHDQFRQRKEQFIQDIHQYQVPDIVKLILTDISNYNDRQLPFNYDKFINIVDEQISDIKQKVSAPF